MFAPQNTVEAVNGRNFDRKLSVFKAEVIISITFVAGYTLRTLTEYEILPTTLLHIPFLLVIFFGVVRIFCLHHNNIFWRFFVVIFISICAQIITLDSGLYSGAFYVYMMLGSYCCIFAFADRPLRIDILKALHIFLVLVAATLISTGMADEKFYPLSLIPTPSNDFFVNVSGYGQTAPFGAAIAGMGLIFSFKRAMHGDRNEWLWTFYFLYFVVFSHSRALLAATLLTLGYIIVSKIFKNRKIDRILFTGIVVFYCNILFFANEIGQMLYRWTQGSVVGGILQVERIEKGVDFASGRYWLWEYHYTLISQNWFGAGLEKVRRLHQGDETQMGTAQAVGESFFTMYLAGFGLFFVPFLAYIIKVWWERSEKNVGHSKDKRTTELILFYILVTIGYSVFAPPLDLAFLVLLAILFTRAPHAPDIKARRS